MAVCVTVVLIFDERVQRDKFLSQGDSSQRIIFVSKTRDKPGPGSFVGEMKDPENEVGLDPKSFPY